MTFDLEQRTVALSAGEFADFAIGPRAGGPGGPAGLWRAQLGSQWHRELRSRAIVEYGAAAAFEVTVTGRIVHRGWMFTLSGRVDQVIRSTGRLVLREIKSVTCSLPAEESVLRADYPAYFAQLAAYANLARLGLAAIETPPAPAPGAAALSSQAVVPPSGGAAAELVFVEAGSGLTQVVPLTAADDATFRTQLDRVREFLELRRRARERLRGLRFRPAFAVPRPGQETTRAELTALFHRHPLVFFEAPTGFGKTGVLLEFALDQLRSGHFDRALYLTGKSTGQLQVIRTLQAMTASDSPVEPATARAGTPVTAWLVRNKGEHCINSVFHCVREACACLEGAATRWAQSGLARFYLDEQQARDLETLRAAGAAARLCPYEITRAALAFNDLWIGDYNYVFAPRNRSLFHEQPGFDPGRTLVLIDEAHNLPSRVADAHSHEFAAADARAVLAEFHRLRPAAALVTAWSHWCDFLDHLRASTGISPSAEDDARHLLSEIAARLPAAGLDFAALGPFAADLVWRVPALLDELASAELPRLWWSPHAGHLTLTCLDAAAAIGAALREFGGVVLASATLEPVAEFAAACGLAAPPEIPPVLPATVPERLGALNKRETRRLFRQLTSAAELLRVEEARASAAPVLLRATTPWRDDSYAVAFDARVDTTFQHRSHHYPTTAATVVALQRAARFAQAADCAKAPSETSTQSATVDPCVAVFFPSYAYAEAILEELVRQAPGLRMALQPKLRELAAQSAWVEEALRSADALFLVLGSSFAESIDSLGGRVAFALVVGPALPEVNAVQRARMTEATGGGASRQDAFRRVYQIPGMTKVNQALGRLVRAPGQRARVVLHCRRFLEPSYAELLEPDYQRGPEIHDDKAFAAWLAGDSPSLPSGVGTLLADSPTRS